jgi:hypothetical protein
MHPRYVPSLPDWHGRAMRLRTRTLHREAGWHAEPLSLVRVPSGRGDTGSRLSQFAREQLRDSVETGWVTDASKSQRCLAYDASQKQNVRFCLPAS